MEATKNISCSKGEGTFDQSTETRWLKKIPSCCKNSDVIFISNACHESFCNKKKKKRKEKNSVLFVPVGFSFVTESS